MVSYLKIEVFAYDLFHSVWLRGGLISRKYDATEIYHDECLSDNDYLEVCDKVLYDAVLCRRILFQTIYRDEITKERDRYWDSVSDFYKYIRKMCSNYDCFGRLPVFERLIATCAFVLNLCFYNRENENVDIIKFGHICWAIYFDDFTEEFYEQGGWSRLKNVANSYTLPLVFLQMCLKEPENAFTEVAKAIENYNNLKQTSIFHGCETISKLWVKSQIENLDRNSDNQVEFVGYEKFVYAEHILNELKRLCSPCALEVLQYDEECSERSVFDSNSFYIPLTPITSEESMDGTKSLSGSSDEIEGDALFASLSVEIFTECEIDDSDFTNKSFLCELEGINSSNHSECESDDGDFANKSCFNELEDINSSNYSEYETDDSDFANKSCLDELEDVTSSKYCDDISNGSSDVLKFHPIEFESICLISDCERDQFLSRSINKLHLNHDTLELEETTISETDISSVTNAGYSVEDQALNATDEIQVQKVILNKQCQMLDDSLDAVELVSNDTSVKVLSVTEDQSSHNTYLKDEDLSYVSTFPNTALSYDNQVSISINEWDEKDLVKNISTPIKPKVTLNKD